jgi:hypothetical protein
MLQKQTSNVSIAHDDCTSQSFFPSYILYYIDNLSVIFKEKNSLSIVKLINLSSNKLKGEIPKQK